MNKETRAFNFEVRAEENEQHGTFISGTPIVLTAAIQSSFNTCKKVSPFLKLAFLLVTNL